MGKVKVMLLASEWSSKHGGLSTFNRELAIHLAKHPDVEVFFFLPKCDQAETEAAKEKHITLVQAEPIIGVDELQWLCHPPKDLEIDFVIGHGVVLGCQAQIIRKNGTCKWIQFVHTDPEELGMFKDYPHAVLKGEEKHKTEVKLCEMADFVVTVGPKLAEEYRSHLQYCKKDVFEFTPGIFSEFSDVEQRKDEGRIFRVLLFGRGDGEDFHLKGFDIAARAVAKLHNAQLIFVGAKSKEQDEVANRLKECNLPARQLRVNAYMEIRDELKKPFSGVDLAIMPSRTEGFGLAALEALSAGLPILVSGNSGFGQALGKVTFGSGCVVPPEEAEDPEEWAKKIKEIKEKPRETRQDESKSLLKNYAKVYNWEEQIEDLVEKMKAIRIGEHAGRKGSGSEPPSEGKKKPVSGDKADFSEQEARRYNEIGERSEASKEEVSHVITSDMGACRSKRTVKVPTSVGSSDCQNLLAMSSLKGEPLTLKSRGKTVTISWKQGSFFGFGGDRCQNYVLCHYSTSRGNSVPVYIQGGYDIPQKLVIDSKLQYGSQDNVLFFVYHDKSQTPYQERFRCNDLQKFVYNAIGISWMVGKYLVDV